VTDQQINEAIALHLGWLRPEHPDCMKHKIGWSMPEKWWMDPKTVLRFGHDIPNYCTDLNAMALVEAALTGDQRANYYTTHLPDVTCCDLDGWIHLQFPKIVSATARQRAEAFLRTIGKWKEESK
jgi:hypothetical protein